MVLNMYNEKKKVMRVRPNICFFFRFLKPENGIFPVEFLICMCAMLCWKFRRHDALIFPSLSVIEIN
ncbi:hypothetical protein TSAR_002246 [Trichomalopsis sarcophagae]|uniref:Uncharacterized protein n=1 Tax=Trichomalopsis sarcophagae TaxID=543379 RepID=A0A232F3G7_9HYME|nr:hypothetical protein TSAR_002246 [Trichomalopsis sarcophagae]